MFINQRERKRKRKWTFRNETTTTTHKYTHRIEYSMIIVPLPLSLTWIHYDTTVILLKTQNLPNQPPHLLFSSHFLKLSMFLFLIFILLNAYQINGMTQSSFFDQMILMVTWIFLQNTKAYLSTFFMKAIFITKEFMFTFLIVVLFSFF